MTTLNLPKKRIDVIDALRGFALMGILILHCLEHFEVYAFPDDPPTLKFLNMTVKNVVFFFFAGKAYAIFSLLFGLSFFIQMKNQADRGEDFRARFLWRMVLLFVIGYVVGIFYPGQIFIFYAMFGVFLIPCYKLPNGWLLALCIFFLLEPLILGKFIRALVDPEFAKAPVGAMQKLQGELFKGTQEINKTGSAAELFSRNLWSAQLQCQLWCILNRTGQLLGLFFGGLLIGRMGIHRDPDKMVHYAKRALLIGLPMFALFYCLAGIFPTLELGLPSRLGRTLMTSYANLGWTLVLIGGFALIYLRLDGKKVLDYLAPVGRMSVSSYMAQAVMGNLIFYNYALGMWAVTGQFYCLLIGIVLCAVQIAVCNWWIKRYYYGPMEWLWRAGTFMTTKIPFRR